MGFKDLALFSDALLAKQAWHLLHNKIHYFTWCLSLSVFLIVQFWKLKKILEVHMLGGVF